VVRDLKVASSKWVHETVGLVGFSWQDGYGAFTASQSHVEEIRRYIANQKEHHRSRTFQEEYVEFLEGNGVEYDERYLW
jgi:putative transposase